MARPAGTGLLLAPAAMPFVLLWYRHPSSAAVRELIRAPGMIGPHLVLLTEMTAVMAVAFLVPFHLQRAAGASPAEIGLTMLSFPLGTMALGLIAGALSDRFTTRRITGVGAVVVAGGVALMIPISSDWAMAELSWRLALIGVGAGLLAGPNQTMAMNHSPRHLLGTTGASTSLARQLGIAFGPTLATTLWALPGYTLTGMRTALGGAAALAMLASSRYCAPRAVSGPMSDDRRPRRTQTMSHRKETGAAGGLAQTLLLRWIRDERTR